MSAQHGDALDAFYGALLHDDPKELYERAPCGYLTTTPDGVLIKANQTFLTLTGYALDDLIGRRRFVDLLTAGGRIYHETHYAPMLRMQGAAREIALDLKCADGSRLPVLVNSVLDRNALGEPTVVRTAVFDASQRREYERELLRAKQRAEASEVRATALARTLQQTLIPPGSPRIPGLEVATAFRPAGEGAEVGGDFFDVFQIGDEDWVVVVGDVCGKGVEAAVVTAAARYTLRAASVSSPSPSAALTTLNEVLLHHDADRFCTVALARLRRQDGAWSATVCCAGHPLPVLRQRDGRCVEAGVRGSLLGVRAAAELTDTTRSLHPGERLVLYTDGVTEARRGTEFFGESRLEAIIGEAHASADALTRDLLGSVLAFQDGPPRDDIAIVTVGVPARG